MITISNIRMEELDKRIKLACDVKWSDNRSNPFREQSIWFATDIENADFFSARVYDPFLPVMYYMAMQYEQDLKVEGNVSKKLYRNLTNYAERIWRDFSHELKPVQLIVDGFDVTEQDGNLIGASISSGVDSLSTLYDRFEKEHDSEYRVNAGFLFNCGNSGDFGASNTNLLYESRFSMNKNTADELGLPIYRIESNIHSFYTHDIQQRVGYLAIWSCVLSMQRKIRKYYISSSLSYEEIINGHEQTRDFDMDEFCGTYLVPLIQTEGLELIYDGAQRRRTGKTENIADWSVAQRHLNVCTVEKATGENCSCCSKCLRTLYALDALGKLDSFSGVFDVDNYKKNRFFYLCKLQIENKFIKSAYTFANDNVNFAKEHGVKVPNTVIAFFVYAPARVVRHLLGGTAYRKLKKLFMGKG